MHHDVVTSQQIYGWRAVCAGCDWRYENTSPSITLRAAHQHSGEEDEPSDADLQAARDALRRAFSE